MYRSAAVLLLVSFASTWADDKSKNASTVEHPYAKAKVGVWVEYKSVMPGGQAMTMKKWVAAKTEDTLTLKLETKIGDMAFPAQEMKVNLKEKFEAGKAPPVPGVKSTVKELGKGKEKIKVGGKEYDCEWTHTQIDAEINGQKFKTVSKVWMCKDVPLDGMVKTESETNGMKTTMELVGAGEKK